MYIINNLIIWKQKYDAVSYHLMMKIRLFVSVHFFGTWDCLSLETVLLFCTISVRKIAVYRRYFHRTRTKSVLKFRILLITESSVLRKGSFPIIGQHFYHFFLLKSYFHMKLIIRLYSKSHDFFFFFFFLWILCFVSPQHFLHLLRPFFLYFCTFFSYFSHAKKSWDKIITLAYFGFTGTNSM